MSQSLGEHDSQPIRVLIADDSLFMRHTVKRALSGHPRVQVVGEARDGLEALEKNAELNPDVIVMDVEMPRMDGLSALSRIMSDRPVPVIMFSSLTQRGAQVTFEALSLGAVDFMAKPQVGVRFDGVVEELTRKVTAAASAKLRVRKNLSRSRVRHAGVRRRGVDSQAAPEAFREAKSMVVIGTSTGGPQSLDDVIPGLPADLESCVVVCQHMPPGFTASLAKRLDAASSLPVREACSGEGIPAGKVLVAPGGFHLKVLPGSRGRTARFETDDGPPVHGVRPAVDVTLFDAAPVFKDRLMVVIMTGMGFDGARGARAAKALGARVIAQDESTSVVWGMPRACYELGVCDKVLPLGGIADEIAKFSHEVRERL